MEHVDIMTSARESRVALCVKDDFEATTTKAICRFSLRGPEYAVITSSDETTLHLRRFALDPSWANNTLMASRRDERREQLRSDILSAADELMAHRGYSRLTLRAIAEELGYAHSVVYQHFESKEQVVAELCSRTFDLLAAEFEQIRSSSTSPLDCLIATSQAFFSFSLDHPEHFRLVFFRAPESPGLATGVDIDLIGRNFFDLLKPIFEAAAIQWKLRLADMDLAAYSWWSSIIGFTMLAVVQGELPQYPSPQIVLRETMRIHWLGLRGAHLNSRVKRPKD